MTLHISMGSWSRLFGNLFDLLERMDRAGRRHSINHTLHYISRAFNSNLEKMELGCFCHIYLHD